MSVTSELIVKLVDQVSGPASKASAGLQGIGKSAATIGKTGWGTNFQRELDKLKVAPKTFREVEQSWRELQNVLSQKPMKAATALGAIDLWKSRTLSGIRAMRVEVNDFKKSLIDVGGVLAGSYVAGRGAKAAIKAGANNVREDSRDYLAGLSLSETLRLRAGAAAMSRKYTSMDNASAHERLRDTAMSLGSVDRALGLSDTIGAGNTVLQSLKGPQAALEESRKFFKALDTLGKNVDQNEIRNLYDGYIKALGVEGADMNMGDVFTLAKRSKSAGASLSNEFLMAIAPSLMQDMSPDRVGTALGSMVSQVIGGRATKQSKAAQQSYGLRDKNGKFLNSDLLLSNPFEYTNKVLIPALQKKGIDTSDNSAVVAALSSLFSNQSVADLFTKMLTQRDPYERKAEQYRKAPGIAAGDELSKRDPFVAYEGLIAQARNLGAALSEHVMGTATAAMNGLAKTVGSLADAAKDGGSALAIVAGALTSFIGVLNLAKNIPGLGRFIPGAIPPAGPLAVPAAVAGGVEILHNATADDRGTTAGARLNKYRGGSLHDAMRRSFNEDRARLGIPAAPGDIWSSGTDAIKNLDQSGPAGNAGAATGEAYKSAIERELQGVDSLIDEAVGRWTNKLNFSASPTISPRVNAPAGAPGKQSSINDVSRKLASRVEGRRIGNFADTEYS